VYWRLRYDAPPTRAHDRRKLGGIIKALRWQWINRRGMRGRAGNTGMFGLSCRSLLRRQFLWRTSGNRTNDTRGLSINDAESFPRLTTREDSQG